jgi:hypothetical protein
VEIIMPWRVEEAEFGDADVVSVTISDGSVEIEFVAFVHLRGRVVTLQRLDIQGPGPNIVGPAALRGLALWLKEFLDVDELRIEGAIRTSGASPGRRPAPIVFR